MGCRLRPLGAVQPREAQGREAGLGKQIVISQLLWHAVEYF